MRKRFLLVPLAIALALAGLAIGWAKASRPVAERAPADWQLVTWEGVSTTYPIYHQNFLYASEPFSVTDVRAGGAYSQVQSYEIRSLDVYRPANENGLMTRRPLVFFTHGGAWTDGYRFWYDFVAQSLTGEYGWVTVVIDYRLTSSDVFVADSFCPDVVTCALPGSVISRTKSAWYPDNIQDVAAAFEWTVSHAGEIGGDAQNTFLFGHSAGGHLVSLLATHPAYAAMQPYIKGVISMSGSYQLAGLNMSVFGADIDQTFHGGHLQNDDELDEASPATYVTAAGSLPPFFLLHCQYDFLSLPEQAVLFRSQLLANGMDVEEEFLTGYTHVTEMTQISDTQAAPTIAITGYIARRISYAVYLPQVHK